jgi:hypothetical protein
MGEKKMEMFDLVSRKNFKTDTLPKSYKEYKSQKTSNRILNYRKIQNWENYFLASAICSVAKSAGSNENLHFFSAFTGDMFTYLYSKSEPTDSGITNYFFMPEVVKKAYASFGYDCIYISNEEIKNDFQAVMNAIKFSVDKGIPILAWGMGNVTLGDGSHYDPLPEGSLIGGYDDNGVLYVNLYPGPDRMEVDNDGYTAIIGGLNATNGLFFLGEKLKKISQKELYVDVIYSIPAYLSLPPQENYFFGKKAFDVWADTLLDDKYFENISDVDWILHLAPYCCVCTSDAYNFLRTAGEKYPDIEIISKILPLYNEMFSLKDEIWELQGGFSPPIDKFRTNEFRTQIADILRKMGDLCDKIISMYN